MDVGCSGLLEAVFSLRVSCPSPKVGGNPDTLVLADRQQEPQAAGRQTATAWGGHRHEGPEP